MYKKNISSKGIKVAFPIIEKTFELELDFKAEDFEYDINDKCKLIRGAEIMGHKTGIVAAEVNKNGKLLVINFMISNAKSMEFDTPELLINKKPAIFYFDPKFVNPDKAGRFYIAKHSPDRDFTWINFCRRVTEKCDFISGKITGKFTPSDGYNLKEMMTRTFLSNELREAEDFTIICQDQFFKFSKQYLSMISPVFKNIMKNTYIESQNDAVKIEDTEPEIIQAFRNVLYHHSISGNDLTPQLLMFADRYQIEPLISICRNKLVKTLSKENFVDVIQAAYWTSDERLLKCGVEFVVQNLGTFKNNPEYDIFLKEHPDFSVKIINMMMCEK